MLTNDIEEFQSYENDSEVAMVKVNLVENTNQHHISEMTSHAFIHTKMILVYYNDLLTLKQYLKRFVITHGGGHSYVHEIDELIEMNLGLTPKG